MVDLTSEEKYALFYLKLSQADQIEENETLIESEDFALNALRKRKSAKITKIDNYMDTRFILPTSNLVERLFSCVGLTFDDLRQNLSPVNLEMQIFLNCNKRFWDEILVSQAISSNE